MQDSDARYVRLLDRVRPEMMGPDHWLKGCDDHVIMTPAQIESFNRSLHMCMPFNESLSFSLDAVPDTMDGRTLLDMMAIYAPPRDETAYYVAGKRTDHAYWAQVLDNRALDAVPSKVTPRFGYSVSRGMIRMFPTRDYMGEDAEDLFFDMNTASECLPYLPLVVVHESRDGKFLFCLLYNIGGWIRREHVALCRDRADWMRRRENQSFLTVTGRELRLGDDPHCPQLSRLLLPMGTRLPLVPYAEAPSQIHGRGVYVIPLCDDTCVGPLPYTSANVIRLAFKLLGDRYGWGGALHANDCSGIVHEAYACFGFLLPRGAKSESDVPCVGRVDVSGWTKDQKMAYLRDCMPGSLLYLPGHIVIYLGMDGGEPYAISATGSMGLEGMAKGEVCKILSVCVNDLSVRRRTGLTWLESMTFFLTLR